MTNASKGLGMALALSISEKANLVVFPPLPSKNTRRKTSEIALLLNGA